MARIAPFAAAASAALILWHAARDKPPVNASAAAPLVYPTRAIAPPPPPTVPAAAHGLGAQQASVASTVQVVVSRKDTLGSIFKRMALDPADLAAIRQLPGIRQSLDYLKPGDAIQVTQSEGSVKELTRKMSETRTLHVVRDEAGFAAKVTENPVQTHIRTASATIDSSLFQAAESAQISDLVALKLANIFAWDIDFVLDIREGDRFTAVYEQIYQDGKYLRDGDVLAAEFVNGGKVYRAVRFVDDAGTIGYYSPEGKPMRKAFLRAPVEFTRVSSVFNPHRMHPILNLIRGHMGTDYAAPIGTPVHAAGDGRVAFEGVRGGYGNAILLSHSNEISDPLWPYVALCPRYPHRLPRPAGRGHRLRRHDGARDRPAPALRVLDEWRPQGPANGEAAWRRSPERRCHGPFPRADRPVARRSRCAATAGPPGQGSRDSVPFYPARKRPFLRHGEPQFPGERRTSLNCPTARRTHPASHGVCSSA